MQNCQKNYFYIIITNFDKRIIINIKYNYYKGFRSVYQNITYLKKIRDTSKSTSFV